MAGAPDLDSFVPSRLGRKEDRKHDRVFELLLLSSFLPLLLFISSSSSSSSAVAPATSAPVNFSQLPSLHDDDGGGGFSRKRQEYQQGNRDLARVVQHTELSSLGAPAKREATMADTFTLSAHTVANIATLSKFWEIPTEFFQGEVNAGSKAGKMMLFTTLATHFRNDGNFSAAEQFVRYSMTLARDLFDDFNSPTTFRSGHAFILLSIQLAAKDFNEARHYVSGFVVVVVGGVAVIVVVVF